MTHPIVHPILIAALPLAIAAAAGPAVARTDGRAAASATPPLLVDPGAFRDKRGYERKRGATVLPAVAATVVPGMDRDAVHRIVGTPQFGEAMTHRFNYILNFPEAGGMPLRCRMQMVLGTAAHPAASGGRDAVERVLWQTQVCADRGAAG